jgi:hypothetical protein
VHGVAGFGANSVIHTAGLIDLSSDLQVVIEVVDDHAHVDLLLPILDEMITGGALQVERVRVLRCRPEAGTGNLNRFMSRLSQMARAALRSSVNTRGQHEPKRGGVRRERPLRRQASAPR